MSRIRPAETVKDSTDVDSRRHPGEVGRLSGMSRDPREGVERGYRYLAWPVLAGSLGVTTYAFVTEPWWRAALGLAGTVYLQVVLRSWRSWRLGRISFVLHQVIVIGGAVTVTIVFMALEYVGTR